MSHDTKTRQIAAAVCETIERDRKNRGKQPILLPVKKRSRWQSGICKICGEYFDCITNEHAHRHGFKNADAMAKSDAVDFGKRVRK